MRKKADSQVHRCHKQNCCGVQNSQDNYLSITDRIHMHNQSKKKPIKSKNKHIVIKDILKQTYELIKKQNQQLHKKLTLKRQKINQLLTKLKDYEQQIKKYQLLEKQWLQSNSHKQEQYKKYIKQQKQQKKYTQLIQDSHSITKQTLQRYKKLQSQFNKYKENTEKKLDKVKSQKQQLINQHTQKYYNKQIQQLKEQLTKFKEDQVTGASLKSLNYLHQSPPPSSHQQKLKTQISKLKASISTLKSQNSDLKSYIKQLQQQLQQRTATASSKQKQLRANLDIINNKINTWQSDYNLLKEQNTNWQKKYQLLIDKYQKKKYKYKINNIEWSDIFKQFIHEIDKLKSQLDAVSQKNIQLIKIYGHT